MQAPPFIALKYGRSAADAADRIIGVCGEKGFGIVPFDSEEYPPLLREIYDPPLVLYTRGTVPRKTFLSVVGTRNADRASEEIAERLSAECAAGGLCVASGMASGIDRFAHLGALRGGKSTVGVLPNGIDSSYPASNRDLFHKIEQSTGSALISEYPPGCRADSWTFVRRNRIIAGMSPACVIIKAGEKSGAMITARFALEHNRELFACGGLPFDEGYAGCQKLILDGAAILRGTEDVLSFYRSLDAPELFPSRKTDPSKPEISVEPGSTQEKIILSLEKGPNDIDTLIRTLGMAPYDARSAIICLEISGIVRRNGSVLALNGGTI
jgi:DNA processing protein